LIEVAKAIAADSDKRLSTKRLGDLLDMSQQSASRYLTALEDAGWILRKKEGRGYSIEVTDAGKQALAKMHQDIGSYLSGGIGRTIGGQIVSGIGEGAYYVEEYAKKICEVIGYLPYPGTLNVRARGGKPDLSSGNVIEVTGFESEGRTFGDVRLIPITLGIGRHKLGCHIIVPERTHHKVDIEIIAPQNLRDKLGLSDGDAATIELI